LIVAVDDALHFSEY